MEKIMVTHYRTQGFVFKKEDRSESDRIFTLFTRDFGRIEVVGRAIRKITSKLRGGIEIFCLSEIEFIQGKHAKTLTDAVFLERFNTLRQVPEKWEVSHQVCLLLGAFIKGQEPDWRIGELLEDFFQKINHSTLNPQTYALIYYYFFWNFVSVLGYGPELFRCARCAQAPNPLLLYFSNQEGGVTCEHCQARKKEGFVIPQDVVKMLRIILKKDWQTLLKLRIDRSHQQSLQHISDQYRQYLLAYAIQ